MSAYVYKLNEYIEAKLSEVGGKAANLMKLSKLEGKLIPKGFCVTTAAFTKAFEHHERFESLVSELSDLKVDEIERMGELSSEIRETIINTRIPMDVTSKIEAYLEKLGKDNDYAIRSSATAEDLPTASFAGQHDTYLNVCGFECILEHIRQCWASLYTDRAIVYRIQNGFEHDKVLLAVVVQKMVHAEASGVMFTADPISSNRKVVSIDAGLGLGEDLVSGHVNSDVYKVCNGQITDKTSTSEKRGTNKDTQILSDEQILSLEKLGRSVESYLQCPQDIEWCTAKDEIYVVQSRPITTLYPLADVETDEKAVYVSSGHLQMMTAPPIKPLGMFFYRSVFGNPPSQEMGGRLYVDITGDLSTFVGRKITKYLLKELGDTLITNAVAKVINNKELIKQLPKGKGKVFDTKNSNSPIAIMYNAYKVYKQNDPGIVKEIIANEEAEIKNMGQALEQLSGGDAVFEYIYNDHDKRRMKIASPLNAGVLTAGLLCARSFDKKIKKWLGETNAADSIIMSMPNSITTQTGLSLMDVTDVIREYDEIIEYLNNPNERTFFSMT